MLSVVQTVTNPGKTPQSITVELTDTRLKKKTAKNKRRCWFLTGSIIVLYGDLVSVSGWKNLWDMFWGCWMLFDISHFCWGSERGRLETGMCYIFEGDWNLMSRIRFIAGSFEHR